jgi:hypothetical protein
MSSSAQKELKQLVKAIEARGFTVEPSNGHQKIYMGGKVVQFEETPGDPTSRKPITLPSTPSDPRWRDNTVSMLIRWRVLEENPFRDDQGGLSEDEQEERARAREEREQRKEEAKLARQAQSEEEKDRMAPTRELRERAERVLEPLGVWKIGDQNRGAPASRRSLSEAARVAYSLAGHKGITIPPSFNAAYMSMRKLFLGEGEIRERDWIETLLDELEGARDPIRLYFELLREELGIEEGGPKGEEPVEPEDEAEPPAAEPLEIDAEDDERVRQLRERLGQAEEDRREAEKKAAALEAELDAKLLESVEAVRTLTEQLEEARAASANGAEPRIPELAFEVLSEVIGQHVTVAGEDGSANLDDVFTMIGQKKEKAIELAKRVAALELGIDE